MRPQDPSEHVNSTLDYQTDLKKTPESETSEIEHYHVIVPHFVPIPVGTTGGPTILNPIFTLHTHRKTLL